MVKGIEVLWGIFLLNLGGATTAFHQSLPSIGRPERFCLLRSTPYGRGAEIWPELNDDPILLANSFPDGVIPDIAQEELRKSRNDEPHTDVVTVKKRQRVSRAVRRILRRAAVKEEDAEYDTKVDKTPAIIALVLLMGGLVQPVDLLVTCFLSGYLSILGVASRYVRSDGVTPVLPSLPPQGHVPALVSNPLGTAFTNSDSYDMWLKFGTVVSGLAPLALLGRYLLFQDKQLEAAKFCARPVFLLCCQAVSESVSRRVMVSRLGTVMLCTFHCIVVIDCSHAFYLCRLHFLFVFWYPSPTI